MISLPGVRKLPMPLIQSGRCHVTSGFPDGVWSRLNDVRRHDPESSARKRVKFSGGGLVELIDLTPPATVVSLSMRLTRFHRSHARYMILAPSETTQIRRFSDRAGNRRFGAAAARNE